MIRRRHAFLLACAAITIVGNPACGESAHEVEPDGGSDSAIEGDSALAAGGAIDEEVSGIEPNSDWRPLPRDSKYEGKTLDELAIDWAHWNLSQTDCNENPASDPDGALCTLDQSGAAPVFFVASGKYRTKRTRCSIGSEQAILIPLAYFYADGVSHPFGINTPPSGLEAEAEAIQQTMRDFKLTVDGLPIDGLEELRVGPIKFSQALPRMDNYYVCSGYEEVAGTLDPIYLVGHFALLPPPSPGTHRIEFGGTYSYVGWDYVSQVSFTFSAE